MLNFLKESKLLQVKVPALETIVTGTIYNDHILFLFMFFCMRCAGCVVNYFVSFYSEMHSCEPAKLVDSPDCSIINEVKACAMNTGTLIFIFCVLLHLNVFPSIYIFPCFFSVL